MALTRKLGISTGWFLAGDRQHTPKQLIGRRTVIIGNNKYHVALVLLGDSKSMAIDRTMRKGISNGTTTIGDTVCTVQGPQLKEVPRVSPLLSSDTRSTHQNRSSGGAHTAQKNADTIRVRLIFRLRSDRVPPEAAVQRIRINRALHNSTYGLFYLFPICVPKSSPNNIPSAHLCKPPHQRLIGADRRLKSVGSQAFHDRHRALGLPRSRPPNKKSKRTRVLVGLDLEWR